MIMVSTQKEIITLSFLRLSYHQRKKITRKKSEHVPTSLTIYIIFIDLTSSHKAKYPSPHSISSLLSLLYVFVFIFVCLSCLKYTIWWDNLLLVEQRCWSLSSDVAMNLFVSKYAPPRIVITYIKYWFTYSPLSIDTPYSSCDVDRPKTFDFTAFEVKIWKEKTFS